VATGTTIGGDDLIGRRQSTGGAKRWRSVVGGDGQCSVSYLHLVNKFHLTLEAVRWSFVTSNLTLPLKLADDAVS